MNLVRAKTAHNKMEVEDSRAFVVDNIVLNEKGFTVLFTDLLTGLSKKLAYGSRELFDKEWEICRNIVDKESVVFSNNEYME